MMMDGPFLASEVEDRLRAAGRGLVQLEPWLAEAVIRHCRQYSGEAADAVTRELRTAEEIIWALEDEVSRLEDDCAGLDRRYAERIASVTSRLAVLP